MFNGLKGKITIPVIAIIVLMVAGIVVFAAVSTANLVNDYTSELTDFTSGIVNDFEDQQLNAAARSVQAYLRMHEQKTRVAAIAMGTSAELISRMNYGERLDVWQYLFDIKAEMGVDEIIVADHNGITVARSHMQDSFGDDVSGVPSIAAGLRQEVLTLYTRTPTADMVITTASPVMDGDRHIGSVVVNFTIGTNEFLDRMKDIFNADFTVFVGDESVASTLINPETGNRAVGTTAAPDVADAVLRRGEHLVIDLNVFGVLPYAAYYFPLMGADGRTPTGMFFIGIPQELAEATMAVAFANMESAINSMNTQTMIMVIIGAASILVSGVVLWLLISRSLKPVAGLKKIVGEVSNGNINVNIDRRNVSKDEIGAVTLDIYNLVDVIKEMVMDLTRINHEFNVLGDIEYRADAQKYQNSYKEMIESVNNILGQQVDDVLSLMDSLNKISDGDFNTTVKDMPGKKMLMPETLRSVTASLKETYEAVVYLAENAANGQFGVSVDSLKFKGNWADVISALNNLMTAVEEPLSKIEHNIGIMAEGDFSLLEGNFKGHFDMVAKSCNITNKATLAYISEIADVLSRMAQGDLTASVNQDYKGDYAPIKVALNKIIDSLNTTMGDISSASEQVLAGARQISSSAMNLANGATQQASSVEELNATIDIINQQTLQNAEDAATANELSSKSTDNAAKGNEAMTRLLTSMQGIKEASSGISTIIKTIQDIAFQTNLLSLNASVEAARAGEHGRGFSVVADEVRSLATRSQESATDTTKLINDSITRVETGSDIAHTTADSLNAIVESANEVLAIITNISNSSKQQAEAIGQVSEGIGQISAIVQSNSALSEETAAASQELNSQADLLKQLVAYFRLRK